LHSDITEILKITL